MKQEGLKMKYFILKPEGDSNHAKASRIAMMVYADEIEEENPVLAKELRAWSQSLAQPDEYLSEDSEKLIDSIIENLCKTDNLFLHNHPTRENDMNISFEDEDHIVIDRDHWELAKQIIKDLKTWTLQK